MHPSDSHEEAALRETVRAIANDYGRVRYAARARAGERATELWDALARGGYVGVGIPVEYGGGGGGVGGLALVCEEVAAAGCPLLLLVVLSVCAPVIERFGTADQRARWLPELASGRQRMAFAITEPDAGSNAHRLTTTARAVGEGWVLSGTKTFISGVDEAAAVLVVARTGTSPDGARAELSLFIVDSDAAGCTREEVLTEVHAAERQFMLFFDGVALPADRLLGRVGDGLRQVFAGLNPERITSAATALGLGRYALARGVSYAKERAVWDAPIGAHQAVAHPLARSHVDLELVALAVRHAAWLYDSDRDVGEAANVAKYAAAEAGLAALETAIQVHGGNGLATDYGLADLWGVARLYRTAPVTQEMVLNAIAQRALGLPRSY